MLPLEAVLARAELVLGHMCFVNCTKWQMGYNGRLEYMMLNHHIFMLSVDSTPRCLQPSTSRAIFDKSPGTRRTSNTVESRLREIDYIRCDLRRVMADRLLEGELHQDHKDSASAK